MYFRKDNLSIMLKIDRQRFIEDELKKYGSILISDMSQKLSCSEETIRRDLRELESEDKLKRIHGGAFLPDSDIEDKSVPIYLRETFISDVKDKLAAYIVSNFILENDTIMLDSSTTCLSLAKAIIRSGIKVTIITNSLRIMDLFRDEVTSIKIIGIGGIFKQKSGSFIGSQAINSISNFVSDKSFISPSAIDIKYGIVDNNLNESHIRKAYIKHSRKTFLVVDHTKLDDIADFIISPISDIDCIVTDETISKEWEDTLKNLAIPVEYC